MGETVHDLRLADPTLNDDSQPSVTSSAEALEAADLAAGVAPVVAPVAPEVVEEVVEETEEDFGTGEYEGRTNAQLSALLASKGLASSGTKEEMIERLRG